MPYDYAVLDNGGGSGGKKPRSAKTKYVRSYLKKKGVTPTKDASMRSTREKKLRAKARAEFAAKGRKSSTSNTSNTSRVSANDVPSSLQGAYAKNKKSSRPTSLQGNLSAYSKKSTKSSYPPVKRK